MFFIASISIISIHNPLRRLLTDDPTFETYLPVDDHAWEDGVSTHDTSVILRLIVRG